MMAIAHVQLSERRNLAHDERIDKRKRRAKREDKEIKRVKEQRRKAEAEANEAKEKTGRIEQKAKLEKRKKEREEFHAKQEEPTWVSDEKAQMTRPVNGKSVASVRKSGSPPIDSTGGPN